MSALHHHHHLSVAPLSRHTVSGLQFRSLLTSDLCSSSMQQEKNKVLCKSSSCCCCFFTVCPSSPDVSVSVQFIWLLSNVASFFCLFVEAFPRLRLLHFSTLRCCSNVTVTFVTERLFTVGVCTRLWPLVFGVVPSYFCEFSFILFSHSPECLTKNKTKKKLHLFLLCCLFASRVVVVEQFCPEEILFSWIL